ncbi:UrcA family protein [Sphingomonas bacterium]|uniref:UrcA family protein n=1 Tax=Sphingomonas bacterium TaxID=1895847 RepID=UPI0015776FD4|nr:UrcA family protein [Sphingomonas bacterium]
MKFGMAALAAIMTVTPALAETTANPFAADRAVLNLRGLDLATVGGQQRLAIRMDQAAGAVCGEGMSTIHLALGAQAQACRADVLADIRSRIATATNAGTGATAR